MICISEMKGETSDLKQSKIFNSCDSRLLARFQDVEREMWSVVKFAWLKERMKARTR